jgi:hypothetical protein
MFEPGQNSNGYTLCFIQIRKIEEKIFFWSTDLIEKVMRLGTNFFLSQYELDGYLIQNVKKVKNRPTILIIHFYIAVLFCSFSFFGLFRNKSVCFGCFETGPKHRNKPKKYFFGFAKQTENEPKQIVFRFVLVRTEKKICLFRGHPTCDGFNF